MTEKTELQRNIAAAIRRKELNINQKELDLQWMNDRMEGGRMGCCLALIRSEAEMEKNWQERTDHAAIVNARAKRETAMGMEIAKVRREEVSALQRRHYLRENDASLKTLARKLEAGYACRDLQQQILHNEYRRLQEKAEERRANETLQQGLFSPQEHDELEERKKREQLSKHGQDLRQQLVNREMQRQCQYEDTLIEKKMLDDIMRTIADEDQREIEQKKKTQDKLKSEMLKFKQAKAAWITKQKEMIILEEKEIERQKAALSDRSAALIAARKKVLDDREKQNAIISAKIMADQDARQKRTEFITLLQEQEYLEKNFQQDQAEKKKIDKIRQATSEALLKQIQEKRDRIKEEKEREKSFLNEVMTKIHEDEEKERLKQQRIREKNKRHCEEVLRQAEEQRRITREGKTDEILRAKSVNQYNEARDAEVAKERAMLMRQHAPNLIGYLQAGVIQKEDLPAVVEGARSKPELAGLRVEALGDVKRPIKFPKCNEKCKTLRDY